MFLLSATILLRGVWTSGLMGNATSSTKGTEKGLDKLNRVISTKNFRHSGILSDNLRDEEGDCSDNHRAVAKNIDPTHTSVIIKKHNIVTMT